jgi:HEAT repeat protein
MVLSTQVGAKDTTAVYITALRGPHWKTRWQAAQALGELSDPRAVEPLIQTLGDSNQWVRVVVAEALGQIGDTRAAEALIDALDDPSIWVRRTGVVALGQIADECAISPLMERLLRPPDVQWPEELHRVIAKALGAIGDRAIHTLVELLDDPDTQVNATAARALGHMGARQAIGPLSVAIRRDEPWVRSAATQALIQMADVQAIRTALHNEEAPAIFWRLLALQQVDTSILEQVNTLLQDPEEQIRVRAATVLSQLWENGGAKPLKVVLGTPGKGDARSNGPSTTEPAGEDKAETKDEEHEGDGYETGNEIEPLLNALTDPSAEVRVAATETLGQVGDARAIPALKRALQDQDSHVRAAAVRSLGEIVSRTH